MRRLALLGVLCAVAATALIPGGAGAEQPWWETCNELPADQIEACFYEHNGEDPSETERRPMPPTAPIRAFMQRRFPAAHSAFIHCPKANIFDYGLLCELRFIAHGRVAKGIASVQPEADRFSHTAWWLTGFHVNKALPRRWKRCAPPPRRIAPGAQSLRVYAVSCKEARDRAWRAESDARMASNLRLPRHFPDGDPHTNTLGFKVTSFRCRGKVVVRPPTPNGENPYGEETATCRTRFGDRFKYVFVIAN